MKKLVVTVMVCMLATCALAESSAFQLSLVPDVAIHSSDKTINGVSLGIWNENPGNQWQIGIVNGATGESQGLQWGLYSIYNYADTYKGAQIGMVNYAKDMTGLQWGGVNIATKMSGLQLGFVNYAESAGSCLQIGTINIISDNAWFTDLPQGLAKGMVIVNWRFE